MATWFFKKQIFYAAVNSNCNLFRKDCLSVHVHECPSGLDIIGHSSTYTGSYGAGPSVSEGSRKYWFIPVADDLMGSYNKEEIYEFYQQNPTNYLTA